MVVLWRSSFILASTLWCHRTFRD